MQTRRQFIELSAIAANSLLFSRLLAGCNNPTGSPLSLELFIDNGRLASVRKLYRKGGKFAALRERNEAIDRGAERKFMESEVRYNDHLYDIARLGQTAQKMAFHFLMTEDVDAADVSATAVRTLMKFPKWDYFLEAGTDVVGIQRASSSVVAVALASDWLGGHITVTEREEWLKEMGERGCEACFRSIYGMRYPDRVVGWSMDPTSTYFEHRPGDIIDLSNWPHILNATNLKAVPASALVIGTVAYARQFGRDETVERWLEQGLYSVDSFKELFAADGSYNEGVSYANYTTSHLIQAIDIVHRFSGENHYDIVNWQGYIDYLYGMSMATKEDPYGIVNISDAGTGALSSVPFYVAGHDNSGRAKWFGENLSREDDEWSVLWYPPKVEATAPTAGPDLWKSDLDWIVARTGYLADDLVVAMRSGKPSNHEHADRNSIMVKCFGEKLVVDPYRPPYSYSDPSWILRTTAGHSAVLINGKGHQYHDGSEGTNASDAEAEIVSTGESPAGMQWTSDATPAYRLVDEHVSFVSRSVAVRTDDRVTLVVDKVLAERPVEVTARFYADNRDDGAVIETPSDSGFIIRRPGVELVGTVWSPGSTSVRSGTLDIPAEVAVQHPFADVSTGDRNRRSLLVSVLQPMRNSEPTEKAEILLEGDEIVVRIAGRDLFRIIDADEHPLIEIIAG